MKFKNIRIIIIAVALIFAFSTNGCYFLLDSAPAPTENPTPEPMPTYTPKPTSTPEPTPITVATSTPTPTLEPTATNSPTPIPTNTPVPTATSTPIPTEIPKTLNISDIPAYSGNAYIPVFDNVLTFSEDDFSAMAFESFSPLDALGRCGVAFANIGMDLMPEGERGQIGQVKPAGWHTVKYDCIADGIQIEAWSIEDNGTGICFNVFCYNVQPGIVIDYATGESHEAEKQEEDVAEQTGTLYVLNKNTKKFHEPSCSSVSDIKEKNYAEFIGDRQEIIDDGYSPCKRCNP